MPRSVALRSSGIRSCFCRAEFETGRVSYDVIALPTAHGICDAVCWRPGLRWIIDRIPVASVRHAMRNGDVQIPPRTFADNRQRRAATVLAAPGAANAQPDTRHHRSGGAPFHMRPLLRHPHF
nr:type I-E CRISPR-associated protein Cas5/CasD [Azospirillum tabaci]